MKYVLDTNIVTRLLDGEERVLSHLTDALEQNATLLTHDASLKDGELVGTKSPPG